MKTAKEVWRSLGLAPEKVIEWGYKQKAVVKRMEGDGKMRFTKAEVDRLKKAIK